MQAPQQSQQSQAQQLQVKNMQARQAVLTRGYNMLQSIYSNVIQPSAQSTIQIPPQNVGLVKGFLLKLTATITNPSSGSSILRLTNFGPSNLLQNLIFTDLQNYQRINTSGWHLSLINSMRQGRPFLSATPSNSPMGYGASFPIISAPSSIAAGASGVVNMYYWIPLAYSENDLTGAIYANVVNATMSLQLTFATAAQACVAASTDPTTAVYQADSAAAGVTLHDVNVQVYQSYIDQLPQGQNGPVLPSVDLNTMYELKNTTLSGIVQGSDFYISYSNFRHFLSTVALFNNQAAGVYPAPGTDINYWSLRSANATDLRKADPYTWQTFTRRKMLADAPVPAYIFDTRDKPIYTTQQGNMSLVLNPSLVNAGASVPVGWEMLANVSNLLNASSLSAG